MKLQKRVIQSLFPNINLLVEKIICLNDLSYRTKKESVVIDIDAASK